MPTPDPSNVGEFLTIVRFCGTDGGVSEYSRFPFHLVDLDQGTHSTVIGREKIVRSGREPVDRGVEVSISIDICSPNDCDDHRYLSTGSVLRSTGLRRELVDRPIGRFHWEVSSNRWVRTFGCIRRSRCHTPRVSCVVRCLHRPTSWRSPPRLSAHLFSAAPSGACVAHAPPPDAAMWPLRVRCTTSTETNVASEGVPRGWKGTTHCAGTWTEVNDLNGFVCARFVCRSGIVMVEEPSTVSSGVEVGGEEDERLVGSIRLCHDRANADTGVVLHATRSCQAILDARCEAPGILGRHSPRVSCGCRIFVNELVQWV